MTLTALPDIPFVQPGDEIARLIIAGLESAGLTLQTNDILIITSKLISKAERRYVDLSTVTPSERARAVAEIVYKDPRLVELILRESTAISRMRRNVLIVRHRLGFTLANAGIDHSNVGMKSGEWVLLLPEDPDRSACQIRADINRLVGVSPGIVITDSHGRPFRLGTVGFAIGVAGLPALRDWRGQPDLFGNRLEVTVTGFGDELAAAAGLLSGQADEGLPVVLARGLTFPAQDGQAADLVRPIELDLFGDFHKTEHESS
ncbi:MAG: coenzyme F420-0:L-glutamate ligase [Anaerolineae bacterium]|nr:coenzyme F420-0:L-glutamate ligase [Anaerolineae bacterium]